MIYYALLGALALQRLCELKIGNHNLALIRHRLVSEPDKKEKNQMMILHTAWFLGCAIEHGIHPTLLEIPWFLLGIILLGVCQLVRYSSMRALGPSWIHLPVAYRGQEIVSTGIYRYCRHPNYLAVVIEIALVPLLTKAYATAILFTFLNCLFLYRRIRMETNQLKKVRSL